MRLREDVQSYMSEARKIAEPYRDSGVSNRILSEIERTTDEILRKSDVSKIDYTPSTRSFSQS